MDYSNDLTDISGLVCNCGNVAYITGATLGSSYASLERGMDF